MNLSQIHIVYFLGIGGIGMSSLARFFNHCGKKVYGYDLTATLLTKTLESEGISIHYVDDVKLIPSSIRQKNVSSLIIYTPAIPSTNKEFYFFRNNNFDLYKRSEILGSICNNYHCLAIAGTHGKTTTSALLATMLKEGGKKVIAFLGGVVKGKNTNFISEKNPLDNSFVVVEADEYDKSFMHLSPDEAVVTSCDADHLDVYLNEQSMIKSFIGFTKKIKPNGFLLLYEKSAHLWDDYVGKIDIQTYGFDSKNDIWIHSVKVKNTSSIFMFSWRGKIYGPFEVNLIGKHNVANTCAAIILALRQNLSVTQLNASLQQFMGIKRRAEIMINTPELLFVDDYAHHPEEIRCIINTVKQMRPNKKISVIFQPHLYSRTRDFAEDFACVLSQAEHIFLLDIYPARELPTKGVTSQLIGRNICQEKVRYISKNEVVDVIKESQPEILLTLGAGDVDQLVIPLVKALKTVEKSNVL